MSVEDVKAEFLRKQEEAVPGLWYVTNLPAALDRLILEVQASGDCRYWAWRQTCEDRYYEKDMETKWCKRCIARQKLKEPVKA